METHRKSKRKKHNSDGGMIVIRKLLGISTVFLVLLLLVNCGGDDDGDTVAATGTTGVAVPSAERTTLAPTGTSGPVVVPDDTDKTLIVGVPNDCGSPDYTSTGGSGGGQWVCYGYVREDLLGSDPETAAIVPYLAEKWEMSANGLSRTFTLRQGIFFTNGEPLNAEVIAFSMDRQLGRTPEVGGLADYDGATDFKGNQKASFTSRLSEDEPYTILSEYVIRFNYSRLDVTHTGDIVPVPPAYIREVGDAEFARHPISTGPYILVNRTPGEEIVFTRNEDYWNKDNEVPSTEIWSPEWKDIVHKVIPEEQTRVSALITGQVDVITSVSPVAVPRLQKDSNLFVVFIAGTQPIRIFMNSCEEFDPNTGAPNPFRDVRVRQAMNYAVDVDGIIENIMTGTEVRQPGVAPLDPYIDYDQIFYYPYDVAKAKELMAEAGYADGLPGSYDIWNPTGRWTASGDVTTVIAEQLRVIGIDARLRPAEYLTVTTGIQDNTLWPMAFFGTHGRADSNIAGYLTPHTVGDNTCMGRWNLIMVDQEIADLTVKAGETVDIVERGKILTEVFKIYADRAYDIPMYSSTVVHVMGIELIWEPTARASTSTIQPRLIKTR